MLDTTVDLAVQKRVSMLVSKVMMLLAMGARFILSEDV